MSTPLRLFNSLTRSIEEFAPVYPGEARVYSCGPTVYNFQHIGNMRAYVFADTLGRALSFKGYELKHVINITDVGHLTSDADAGDDKMETAAARAGKSAWDVAKFYTDAYWRDIERLNIRQPAKWSIATDYVPAMIAFAEGIAEKHCYRLDSGLYFDTSTVPEYGRLARAATDAGEGRIDAVEGKRHSTDFAIWRTTPPGETRQMEWDSPWGRGAPGWHLECSVMSEALLGLPFDIHTGGIDHREIHHPNEIAQNQARCGSPDTGARIWMHNNFLIDRGGKMSKSAGDFLTLQALVDRGFHPLAYRLMCLQAHYRSELEFSWENLAAAFTRLKRMFTTCERLKATATDWDIIFADYLALQLSGRNQAAIRYEDGKAFDVGVLTQNIDLKLRLRLNTFADAIGDDLNTPQALVWLEDVFVMKGVPAGDKLRLIGAVDYIFGLRFFELGREAVRVRPTDAALTQAEVEVKLANRKVARAAKDFAASDRIRDELAAAGVEVMDGDPLGWDWKLSLS